MIDPKTIAIEQEATLKENRRYTFCIVDTTIREMTADEAIAFMNDYSMLYNFKKEIDDRCTK